MTIPILDKLKSLVGKVDILSGIKINSDNDNRQVHLHVHISDKGQVPPAQLKEVMTVIQGLIREDKDGFLMTTSESKAKLELISGYEKEGRDSTDRKFIADNLPAKDASIWYSALILREQFKKGENETVGKLKNEISTINGDRGRNIANLCTAGYLESHIIPVFEYAVGVKGDKTLFLGIYETIVTEYPFAVFVSQERTVEQIYKEVETKINQVKTYGWKKVSLHGIGQNNVKIILEVSVKIQETHKEQLSSVDFSSYESEGKIIKVDFNLT